MVAISSEIVYAALESGCSFQRLRQGGEVMMVLLMWSLQVPPRRS